MKICISGINGYLGSSIAQELQRQGHDVSGINRNSLYDNVLKLSEKIKDSDIVINLVGAPIFQRWTKSNKEEIYNSRIVTTKNLVKAIKELDIKRRPVQFIQASAIGIYKARQMHDETSSDFDEGFPGQLVKDWEEPLSDLPITVKRVVFRIGPVLGKSSKTITKLLPPFKLGFGAVIGNGNQSFPFVHEKDVVRAFIWALDKKIESDTFNLVAPQSISNRVFTKVLAKELNRKAFLTVPGFVLKIIYGKAAVLLTESPEVSSEKIIKAGFLFRFPDIHTTLRDILQS